MRSGPRMMRRFSARLQTLLVLVGLVLVFGLASPHFLTTDNLLNVMQQSAINAILGIGLTFVIISAGIDLSVGSILALCGLVVADLLVAGHSVFVAVVAGLLVGLGCGLLHGVVTPVRVLVVAVLYVLAHLVLTRTKLGRYSYAIGGNEQAAWLSGVRVGRYKVAIYTLSGLVAGVAAVL